MITHLYGLHSYRTSRARTDSTAWGIETMELIDCRIYDISTWPSEIAIAMSRATMAAPRYQHD